MPLGTTIVHPRLFESLRPSFWRHTVTIQRRTDPTLQDEVGGPETSETLNPWVTLSGHGGISCNVGRNDALGPKTSEIRQSLSTFDAKMFQAMLNGIYPAITEQHRAEIDGAYYNIRGVVHDSGKNLTELVLEIIT